MFKAVSIFDLKAEDVSEADKKLNERLKYARKFRRDILNMPRRVLRKLKNK